MIGDRFPLRWCELEGFGLLHLVELVPGVGASAQTACGLETYGREPAQVGALDDRERCGRCRGILRGQGGT